MKVAIIGSGISGLGLAYMLNEQHDIVVYEKNTLVGGHTRTICASTSQGDISVDTGFIVFNEKNYPLLTGLFKHLGVSVTPSNMSFGVSVNHGWLEYGTRELGYLFAQKQNLIRPAYWQLLKDILRFNKYAPQYLTAPVELSLRQCLKELKLGDWFRKYYLAPMGAAIWSMPVEQTLDFPASTFIRFFANHGLLNVKERPQWYTVTGGSQNYINKLTASFESNIKLNCGADKVIRHSQGVTVEDTQGSKAEYDAVVFACHADQALNILVNPTEPEKQILGCFQYQINDMYLHSDTSLLPYREKAWSSWNYLCEDRSDDGSRVSVSYWMNNLQPLGTDTPMVVTLNPTHPPRQSLVHDYAQFEHPVFDSKAIEAQSKLKEIQGQDRVWFCGAYQRYGFHEDGLLSAVNVADGLGIQPNWVKHS